MTGTAFEERWHEFARFECPEGHILQKSIGDRRRVQCGSCGITYTRDDLVDRKETGNPKVGRWSHDSDDRS